jgi:hypothetical protein
VTGIPWIAVRTSVFALLLTGTSAGFAQDRPAVPQPQVDLGQTSFLDGEAGSGGLAEINLNGGSATDSLGPDAGHVRVSSRTALLHGAYISTVAVAGGQLGGEILLPFATVHVEAPGQSQRRSAFGDPTFTPFIQWSHAGLFGKSLSVRLAIQLVAPLGAYQRDRGINIGQNAWQVSPYVAFTWRPAKRWEVSGRGIYDWAGRNGRPSEDYRAAWIQAGDAVAMNVAASFEAIPNLHLGTAGYHYRQIGDARIDVIQVARARQRITGIGPGLRWRVGKIDIVGNAYGEFAARNRPSGYNLVLRIMRPF